MEIFYQKYNSCKKCTLSKGRNQVVFGVGDTDASLMLISEAPGKSEDLGGKPFIGRAGKLLDKIIDAIGLSREDIWIGNTCLCRPPNNRNPTDEEIKACRPRLIEEINFVNPKIIVLMGRIALKAATNKSSPISSSRGWVDPVYWNVKSYLTYHPAAALYNQKIKIPIWEDWKRIKKELDNIA